MKTDEIVRLLALNGYHAYKNLLVGNRPPYTQAMYRRMTNPRPGDLVLETTTRWRDDWPGSGLGYLERVADERLPDCDDCGTEDAWYIKPLLGGDVARWVNATFIALPDSRTWHEEVEAESAAMVTARG